MLVLDNAAGFLNRISVRQVLLIALLARLAIPALSYGIWRDPGAFHMDDSEEYVCNAAQILEGRGFSACDGMPEFLRTPGYAIVLVPAVASGHLELTVILLQAFLGLACVFVIYQTAALVADDRRVAVVAALLYAIEFQAIVFTSMILSEALFTLLVMSALTCLIRYHARADWHLLAGSALLLAGATYTRPVAYLLPLAAAVLLFWHAGDASSRGRRVIRIALFLLIYAAALLPWHVRNSLVLGSSQFSSTFAYNAKARHAASVAAAVQGKPYHEVVDKADDSSTDVLWQHPFWALALQLQGSAWALLAPNSVMIGKLFGGSADDRAALAAAFDKDLSVAARYVRFQGWRVVVISAAATLATIGYYALAFFGFARLYRRNRFAPLVLLAFAGYLMLVGGGQMASGRFRHPIMPAVCLLAGVQLAHLGRRVSSMAADKAAR